MYKHRKILYGEEDYSRVVPGTTVTGENGHTGTPQYQLVFSSFRRGPPSKNYI